MIKAGDISLISEISSSGVRLFYAIMSEYKILSTCPPIKKFVLGILQIIGNVCNNLISISNRINEITNSNYNIICSQVFIMNNEKECLRIENTALNYPELSDILIPIFSPSSTSINIFTQAYKIIVNHCNALYEPILLKLLSKVSLNLIFDNMK